MNGSLVPILLAVIGGLFALIQGLVAIVIKMHISSDDETRERMEAAVLELQTRQRDILDKLSGSLAREGMRRKDDRREDHHGTP